MSKAAHASVLIFFLLLPVFARATDLRGDVVVPYFRNDGGFRSELVVHNYRIDRSTSMEAVAFASGSRIVIATAVLAPKETKTFAIAMSLRRGALHISHDGDPGAVGASVLISNVAKALFVKANGIRRDRVVGTRFAAVVWNPAPGTYAQIEIHNASPDPRRVQLFASTDGERALAGSVLVESWRNATIDLNQALAVAGRRMRSNGALGLELAHDGAPGTVIASGHLLNVAERHAASINFVDLDHSLHDRKLRTAFAFLGPQPYSYRFEHGTTFRSVCNLYNAGVGPLTIVATWVNPGAGPIVLGSVSLAAHSTFTFDLSELQGLGVLPADAHHGAIELAYSGSSRLVAQTMSLDQSAGYRYNLVSTMSGELSDVVGSDYWQIGAYATTLVGVTSGSAETDVYTVELFERGTKFTLETFKLDPGASTILNLRSILGGAVDRSGSLSIRGARGTQTDFMFERLLINGSPSPIAASVESMYDLDGGGDMRPFSLTLETELPAELDQDDEPPATVDVMVSSFIRYADGSIVFGAGGVSFYASSGISIYQWGSAATVTRSPEGSEWDGWIEGGYLDECSDMYFTHVITMKITNSAYAFVSHDAPNHRCLWRATCSGTCPGAIDHYSTENQFGTCFTGTRVFKQCWDFWVSGTCTPRLVCTGRTVPGVCN